MELQESHKQLFGNTPITKLFFKCAIPSMISMAAASLYMIADGIFVGRFIGPGALAAVNLVMPIIMVTFALSDMIAIGSAVQISIRLGEQNNKKASLIFSFSCKMILAIAFFAGSISWVFAPFLVSLLGAEGEVATMAVTYMRVYAFFSPLIMGFFAIDNYLRICGRVRYSMAMNLFTSVANIGLDWLFIVKFRWGIGSAALASCLCLALGNLICLYPFVSKKMVLYFTRGHMSLAQIGNIFANGSSEFFSNIAASVCMVLFNAVLMRMSGYMAVAAFSIVMYIDSVVKSIIFGMSDSVQPAISYNYGAMQTNRVFALEKRAQISGFIISFSVMIWMLLKGDGMIRLFSDSANAELITMSTRAMKLFSLSYLVSWFGIISGSFFTALNRPLASLAVSFCQTFVFPVCLLLFLPTILGLDGVWLTSLFAGILTSCLTGVLMMRVLK
ncbi:MAG: MATE family efflux transporter [Clostridium sp.]